MSSKSTMSLRRSLIPEFPDHLTFSVSPALITSTRKIPLHKTIHAAARAGDAIDVSLFIREGVDVNSVDNIGDSPIHYACISRHRSQHTIVKRLLANGANPLALTITGQTVLHLLAVDSKSPSTLLTLRHLVEYSGVDINIEDEIKRTPLQYLLGSICKISKRSVEDIVKFFIVNGARLETSWVSMHTYNFIIECLILRDGKYDDSHKFTVSFHDAPCMMLHSVWNNELVLRKALLTWGPGGNCSISELEFLRMSEKRIADLANEAPLLYFAIRQSFRACKGHEMHLSLNPPIPLNWKRISPWKMLSRQYQAQFNTFCYYFVKEQLKKVNFTNGRVSLNYDCIRTLASFLRLEDLVNLCEAFSFEHPMIKETLD